MRVKPDGRRDSIKTPPTNARGAFLSVDRREGWQDALVGRPACAPQPGNLTSTGTGLSAVVPFPSCPWPLRPQQYTWAPVVRPHV